MRILIVTDSPITRGIHASVDHHGTASVQTLSNDVDILFYDDFIKSGRGRRYDLIMIPRTLELMEDIHHEVCNTAKNCIIHNSDVEIRYY